MANFRLRLIYIICIGLPLVSLFLNAISWLRFGLDLPFFDDWRGYATGQIHSLELNYLFRPVNDTLAPVGFALDALAQRYLDGNSIAYQFLSMVTVLGGLLWLQWRLLVQTMGKTPLTAVCFLVTLLMLQPGSYWGRENLAYHQALPLLFILASLSLLLTPSSKYIWRMPVIFILSLFAGFSYISGAFGVLAVGIGLLVACGGVKNWSNRGTLLWGGLILSISGLFSSAIQYFVAIPNGATHRPDAPLALPNTADFWIFYLGKLGRSLLLPQNRPLVSLVATIIIVGIALFLIFIFFYKNLKHQQLSKEYLQVGTIFIALTSVVFVYMLLIAAGRTNLRPPEIKSALQIFSYGYYRFHFFWATLLWPWLIAMLLTTVQEKFKPSLIRIEIFGLLVVAIFGFFSIGRGALDHTQQYKAETFFRIPTITCLSEQLQKGGAIFCPEFNMPDFRSAYDYGLKSGASFAKHFPLLPIPLGSNEPSPWFRLTRDQSSIRYKDMAVDRKNEMSFQTGTDSQIILQLEKADDLSHCLILDVSASLIVPHPDTAQLYYTTTTDKNFSEQQSVRISLKATTNQPDIINFRVSNPNGFGDSFRFDPVTTSGHININEVELRCRWSTLDKSK